MGGQKCQRRIHADDHAAEHREGEVDKRVSADDQHEDDRDDRGDRRVDGTHDDLVERTVGAGKEAALHLRRGVLADAVEHDDGIVERVTDDGQQGCDNVGGDFHVEEQARPGIDAEYDDHVVEQADKRDDTHARLAIANGNDGQDAKAREEERQDGAPDDRCTPAGANGLDFDRPLVKTKSLLDVAHDLALRWSIRYRSS